MIPNYLVPVGNPDNNFANSCDDARAAARNVANALAGTLSSLLQTHYLVKECCIQGLEGFAWGTFEVMSLKLNPLERLEAEVRYSPKEPNYVAVECECLTIKAGLEKILKHRA